MKILALAFLLSFVDINAAQDCGVTTPWDTAPYETERESLSDPNGTPLGFRRGITIPNPELMPKYPCVTFSVQSSIQYIEVLAEVVGFTDSKICVSIYGTNAVGDPPRRCGQGLAGYCGNVVGDSNGLTALFDCDSSCDLSDIEIYYRVVTSYSLDVDLENWCQNNRTGDYPSELLLNVPPTNDITPAKMFTEGAMTTHPLSLITLLSFLIAVAYLRHYLNL